MSPLGPPQTLKPDIVLSEGCHPTPVRCGQAHPPPPLLWAVAGVTAAAFVPLMRGAAEWTGQAGVGRKRNGKMAPSKDGAGKEN